MVRRRPAAILLRDGLGRPPFSTALIQAGSMIFAVCRPVDLRATLIRVVFFAGHSLDAALRLIQYFQRACAWSLSTSARASSVILSNSGHGR
jgi:hypothetical protein